MFRKMLFLLACCSLLSTVAAYAANPDSVVIPGDLRILGDGYGLVFPDGSIQYKAAEQGPAGADGINSLTLLTDESPGSNCTNGGVKIQVGPDENRNGVLDAAEVVQTKYICTASVGQANSYCWSISKTENEHGTLTVPETFTAHVTLVRINNSQYLVQGYVEVPGDNPCIMNGSGLVIGSNLYITLSSGQLHTDDIYLRDGGVIYFQLDSNTMSGTFFNVRLDFDRSTHEFDQGYAAGSVTPVACP